MRKYFLSFTFLLLALASAMAQKTATFEYAHFTMPNGKKVINELWTGKSIATDAFGICTPMDLRGVVLDKKQLNPEVAATIPFASVKGGELELIASEIHPEASFDKTNEHAEKPIINKEGCASAIGQWVGGTSFIYETRVTFKPESNEDFAGILLYVDDRHVMEFGISCDNDNNPCLRIKASLGEFQVGSKTWKINTTKNVKLRAVVENDHIYFRYLIGGGVAWRNVGMPISTEYFVKKNGESFEDLMVGLFAIGHE